MTLLLQIQSFNWAGASPFSKVTKNNTSNLPPVGLPEVSEKDQRIELETKDDDKDSNEDDDDQVIKYLTLGGCLAGSLVVFMLLCTALTFFQRKKKAAALQTCVANGGGPSMTEIQDKYADTAVQITHQSFSNLDNTPASTRMNGNGSSYLFSAKDINHRSNFEMTLLPDPTNNHHKNHSISDSMFSSGHNSADLNSLGHEEYSDEPRSWRRSRRSEESWYNHELET